MLDIKFVRENPDIVKENIRKKFQDEKLPLVDEVIDLDARLRAVKTEADSLRAKRNTLSKQIGVLMGQARKDPAKKEEAEAVKAEVQAQAERLAALEAREPELEAQVRKIMLVIPNIIDPSVPIGKDDSQNVEVQRFGAVPDGEILQSPSPLRTALSTSDPMRHTWCSYFPVFHEVWQYAFPTVRLSGFSSGTLF